LSNFANELGSLFLLMDRGQEAGMLKEIDSDLQRNLWSHICCYSRGVRGISIDSAAKAGLGFLLPACSQLNTAELGITIGERIPEGDLFWIGI
jgi:hypothetical protein